MSKLLILISITTLFSACTSYDPEGIWEKTTDPTQQLLFLKTDGELFVRRPSSRNFMDLRKDGDNKYKSVAVKESFNFKSNDRMEVTFENRSAKNLYHKIIPEQINPFVISSGMSKEQVVKFIGTPDKEITEGQKEKWLYNNTIVQHSLLLIFEANKVVDMNGNFKEERDLGLIKEDMSYKVVIKLIGNPDEFRVDQNSKSEYQEWYYGKNSAVVFENKKVIDVELDINEKIVDLSDMFSNMNQEYSLMDLVNDRPAGFVIEGQHTESLDCECKLNNGSPSLRLKGEKSNIGIALMNNKKYSVIGSYNTLKGNKTVNVDADKIELSLNSTRFEKGRKLLGFIRIEDNCITEPNGNEYPCYFKGTFECTFK